MDCAEPLTVYDFLRDQGSLISGVLALIAALIAGGLAYFPVMKQNKFLKDNQARHQSEETLIAARFCDGLLRSVGDSDNMLAVVAESVDPLLNQIGKLTPEIVNEYFEIRIFLIHYYGPKSPRRPTSDEWREFYGKVARLREQLKVECMRAEKVLRRL
jgi:hypothetical protein